MEKVKVLPTGEVAGLTFDSRDGTFHFQRPNGEGGYEYSQDFKSRKEAVAAYENNKLIYTD